MTGEKYRMETLSGPTLFFLSAFVLIAALFTVPALRPFACWRGSKAPISLRSKILFLSFTLVMGVVSYVRWDYLPIVGILFFIPLGISAYRDQKLSKEENR